MILRYGDTSAEVYYLQERLNKRGYLPVFKRSVFDDAVLAAIKEFQKDSSLVVDGVYGPKTHSALMGSDTSHLLSQSDLKQAADSLGVDLASVEAVRKIESRGAGFLSSGKPIILFERHIMRRRLAINGYSDDDIEMLSAKYENIVSKSMGGYRGGSGEYVRLNKALKIDEDSALESCSWGMFQIMGFHWSLLGYKSVADFVARMSESEGNQLMAFVAFIKADAGLHEALKTRDWPEFARRYNGPAYKKNHYDDRLADAYAAAKEVS